MTIIWFIHFWILVAGRVACTVLKIISWCFWDNLLHLKLFGGRRLLFLVCSFDSGVTDVSATSTLLLLLLSNSSWCMHDCMALKIRLKQIARKHVMFILSWHNSVPLWIPASNSFQRDSSSIARCGGPSSSSSNEKWDSRLIKTAEVVLLLQYLTSSMWVA